MDSFNHPLCLQDFFGLNIVNLNSFQMLSTKLIVTHTDTQCYQTTGVIEKLKMEFKI